MSAALNFQNPMNKLVFLKDIDKDSSPVVRSILCEDTIQEYQELYRLKDCPLPHPVVFEEGRSWLIGDGWHRIEAATRNGMKAIVCNVAGKGIESCVKYACGANAVHGLRRSNADKRQAVMTALQRWPNEPSTSIAAICNVSHTYVDNVRKPKEVKPKPAPIPQPTPEPEPEKPVAAKPENPKPESPKPATVKPEPHYEEPKPTPQPLRKDPTGLYIPRDIQGLWDRSQEVQDALTMLSRLKGGIEQAQREKDILYAEVNFSALLAHLDNAYGCLKVGIPYVVCPSCQGRLREKCKMCAGRGFISKFRWDSVVTAEEKEIRKMAVGGQL